MAGMREEKKTIGGREVTVRTLPFGKGREMLMRVMSVVAPAFGNAKGGAASVLASLGEHMDNDTITYVADVLGAVSSAKVDGIVYKLDKESAFEAVFDGDYLSYFEWIAFGLEVNYKDFFAGLINRLGQSGAGDQKLSQ